MSEYKVGDNFKSKNGLIGEIKLFSSIPMLEVRNSMGRIMQTLSIRKIDLGKFERII